MKVDRIIIPALRDGNDVVPLAGVKIYRVVANTAQAIETLVDDAQVYKRG